MDDHSFEHRIAVAQEQLQDLLMRIDEPDANLRARIEVAGEELSHSLEELRTAHQQLDTDYQRLIDELEALRYTIAYDLRPPLALITGYADVLVEKSGSLPPDDLHRLLRAIAASGRQACDIIDKLMRPPRRSIEPPELVLLDMASIVEEVLARLEREIEAAEAEVIRPAGWPQARGYSPWLEEIWFNYTQNAIEYGGDPPRVELGGEQLPDGTARFWVRDHGDGIAENRLSHL